MFYASGRMRGLAFSGLWRHSEFVKLWTGQTISLFGTEVSQLAIPLTAALVLKEGQGLPGQVWAGGTPSWLGDLGAQAVDQDPPCGDAPHRPSIGMGP